MAPMSAVAGRLRVHIASVDMQFEVADRQSCHNRFSLVTVDAHSNVWILPIYQC